MFKNIPSCDIKSSELRQNVLHCTLCHSDVNNFMTSLPSEYDELRKTHCYISCKYAKLREFLTSLPPESDELRVINVFYVHF